MTAYYLIKRGMFYRPKAAGYTYVASEAGIFSADEVAKHVAGCSGEVTMVPVLPKPITDEQVEAARAGLWAAHTSLALNDLKRKLLDFARGVLDKVPQSNEPRVVGFKAEWEALMDEASKPAPLLPESDNVRKAMEAQS